jgi:uncharacterized membrane protein (DUF106 family)
MTGLFNAIAVLFDLLMAMLKHLGPAIAMIVVSAITGVLMLIIFKYTSDQPAIKRIKDAIKANFYAITLFQDSLRVLIRSTGRIVLGNLKYMGYNLIPLAVMLVPVLLLLVQLNFWYGYEPLGVSQELLVKASFAPNVDLSSVDVKLKGDDKVSVITPALRIPQKHEADWRIRGTAAGKGSIELEVAGRNEVKSVIVSPHGMARLTTLRHSGGFWDSLLYPGEKALDSSSPIKSVEVIYTPVNMNFLGLKLHWLIVYFVISILFGLALKGVFKVEI